MSKVDLKAVEALLQEIESEKPTSASGLWLSGEGDVDSLDPSDALVAVEVARRLEQGERLVEAKGAKNKAVRKAAGKAIHGLRGAGIEIAEERSQGSWSMGAEARPEVPPVGLIGLPQGDGYFPYILVAYGDQGACVCAGVAGAGQGFQDSDHAHVGRSRAREIVDNARRDHNLTEVPFHVALHFTERAFDEGGGRRPHGWSHMLESVTEATRNSARLIDPLQRQDPELDPKALDVIDALLDGPRRVVFNLPEHISGPAVDGCLTALTSELALDDKDRRRRIAREVAKAATEVMAGETRASWILALDVVTCIAETGGWDDARRSARHTSLAMRSGYKGEDIPFVRQWCERQLLAVTEMVMSVRADRGDQST